jgi:hypothetical protein
MTMKGHGVLTVCGRGGGPTNQIVLRVYPKVKRRSSVSGYQIFARTDSARYILSPGLTPNAS